MRKQIVTFLVTLLIAAQAVAQQKVIQLYDGPAPGSEFWDWDEAVSDSNGWGSNWRTT